VYRTFILFPWAIPQVIAVLAWRGEFNFEYGYFNIILRNIGLNPINWMTDPAWNFFAINLTNWWLGVPFMSAILLGGLQSIDTSYYEAAEMDGATKFQQLRNITLPLMQPVMTPAIILGVIWTFNQFNIPYFINQQELESSDILVTALFRAAFEYSRYGFAAAFALVIFVILILFTIFYMKVTGFQLQSGQEKKRLAAAKAVGE
jgi:arabinogalactan oligomer/maltooligosaccharide transport system permease protein